MSRLVILPDLDTGLDPVFFDTVMTESPEFKAKVTAFPVEVGTNVADHVRPEPLEITFDGVVTMTPLDGPTPPTLLDVPSYTPPPFSSVSNAIGAGIDAIKDLLFGGPPPIVVSAVAFPVPFDPVSDTESLLEDIVNAGAKCTITLTTGDFDSMVLTSVKRTREDPGEATFTITSTFVRQASSETVAAPKPLLPSGANAKSMGAQTPEPADPATGLKGTFLKGLADGVKSQLLGGG